MWESPHTCTEKCKLAPLLAALSKGCLCVCGVHTQGERRGKGKAPCRLCVLYSKVVHPVFPINYFLFKFDYCAIQEHTSSLPCFSDLQKIVFLRLCLIQQSLIQHLQPCWNQLRLLHLPEEFLFWSETEPGRHTGCLVLVSIRPKMVEKRFISGCSPCGSEAIQTLSIDKIHLATWSLPPLHIK